MNPSFYRKIAYLTALVALLFPMAMLGAPSTRSEEGGKLAQLRSESKLGQADLGAIDPASETIRMATLGLRGFAVTMLWNKANEYKKTEDWTSFEETLKQLARLQPYFVKVWQYQAWNLTYNVSVELDDVKDRFFYVKEGINYLKEGTQYLRDNPTLLDDLGWFTGNKVGRADEHVMYRKMFREDKELHSPDTPAANRDNWLVSREWYDLAISSIDDKKQPIGTKNPVTFFDSPARSQMSYAEAIQEEGVYLSRWKAAWQEGARLWRDYANREMKSTDGYTIRLADQEKEDADAKQREEELEAMSPGLKEVLREEAEAKLTAEQKQMLKEPPSQPSAEQSTLLIEAQDALNITPPKIADRIAKDHPEKASEARKLAAIIAEATARSRSIGIDRDVANFEYWRVRCEIEQTSEALQARELALEAEGAFKVANLEKARQLYEQSFSQWSAALDQFPKMRTDTTFGSDLMEFVHSYHRVLEQLDLSLSDKEVANKFALWDVVEANDGERKYADAIAAHQGQTTGIPKGTPAAINPAEGLLQ